MKAANIREAAALLDSLEATRALRDSIDMYRLGVTYDQTSLHLHHGMPTAKALQQTVYKAIVAEFTDAMTSIEKELHEG